MSAAAMGIKRNRFLIRQPRIKRDSDTLSQTTLSPSETCESSLEPLMRHQLGDTLLTVPPRFERTASEPAPSPHLLSVPSPHQGTPFLVKQHSHPLLPSQMQHTSATSHSGYTLHRQLSHPLSSTTTDQQILQLQTAASTTCIPSISEDNTNLCIITTSTGPLFSGPSASCSLTTPGFVMVKKEQHLPSENIIVTPPITKAHSSSGVILSEITTRSGSPILRVKSEELQRSASSPQALTRDLSLELVSQRSSHCPILRPGPALGCNFCWNTIDAHGRILRRKTKYHCPECQTNLCIVPCFQEYHERMHSNETSSKDTTKLSSSGLRSFPKTESI